MISMLIEKISLKNIRSYNGEKATEVEIPPGTVLFEGDVGSGKSTILYAIEFALFGLGDMPGNYILSEGADEGFVTLWFSAEGKRYEVHRGLKRRKNGVSQEDCYIVEEGKLERLSPSDLKARIIEILRFNEPLNPRAGSLIFRYAVFTPQEQMKEIVLRNADERLQILRRIFGVEDYKVAMDNSELLRRRLNEEARLQKQLSSELEAKEKMLKDLQDEILILSNKIPELEKEERDSNTAVQELLAKQKEMQNEKGRVQEIAGKIPELKRAIERLEDDIDSTKKKIQKVEQDIAAKEKLIEEFKLIKPPSEHTSEELEEMLEKVSEELTELIRKRSLVQEKKKTTEELIEKGICPVCGQKIEPAGFGERKEHLANELTSIEKELHSLNSKKEELNRLVKEMRGYERKKGDAENAERDLSELKTEHESLANKLSEMQGDLVQERKRLSDAEEEARQLSELSREIASLEKQLEEAIARNRKAARQLEEAKTKLQDRSEKVEELTLEVEKMKNARARFENFATHVNWLDEYFQPTLAMIERQVMVEMNVRFNEQFQRFFSSLVEEPDVRVRVNEEFTPIFERQGYEQEFEALSGGERTSIALAYRLALNMIVQQESASGAGELLILDEPTDGFSKEQLSKMRDVIKECNCRQVIIVSHERELESMAEHIFIVEKLNGTSTLRKAG